MTKIYEFSNRTRKVDLETNENRINITASSVGKAAFLWLVCIGLAYLFTTKEPTKAAYFNGIRMEREQRDELYAA